MIPRIIKLVIQGRVASRSKSKMSRHKKVASETENIIFSFVLKSQSPL